MRNAHRLERSPPFPAAAPLSTPATRDTPVPGRTPEWRPSPLHRAPASLSVPLPDRRPASNHGARRTTGGSPRVPPALTAHEARPDRSSPRADRTMPVIGAGALASAVLAAAQPLRVVRVAAVPAVA